MIRTALLTLFVIFATAVLPHLIERYSMRIIDCGYLQPGEQQVQYSEADCNIKWPCVSIACEFEKRK